MRFCLSRPYRGPEREALRPLIEFLYVPLHGRYTAIHTARLGGVSRMTPPRSTEIGALASGLPSLSLSQVDLGARADGRERTAPHRRAPTGVRAPTNLPRVTTRTDAPRALTPTRTTHPSPNNTPRGANRETSATKRDPCRPGTDHHETDDWSQTALSSSLR